MDAKKPYAVAFWYPWSDPKKNAEATSFEAAVFKDKIALDKFLREGAAGDDMDDVTNRTFVILLDKPKVLQLEPTLVEVK